MVPSLIMDREHDPVPEVVDERTAEEAGASPAVLRGAQDSHGRRL